MAGRTVHTTVETYEGTLLYSDDQGFRDRRAVAFLALTMLVDEGSGAMLQSRWRAGGPLGSIAQMIAEYYGANPGLHEAVEGLYAMVLKRKQAGG